MTPESTSIAPDTDADIEPAVQRRVSVGRRLVSLAGVGTVLLVWELVVRLNDVPSYLVPAPSLVWTTTFEQFDVLFENAIPTVIEALLGFLVGNIVAVALAVLFVHVEWAHRALMPIAVFVRTIPIIAIAPLLVIFFGYGLAPKVIVAALITFFPTLVNMMTGLRAVDRSLIELMTMLSASRLQILTKARWFAAMPFWFSALRVSITMSVLGAIVAEWVGARKGLGYLIIQTTYDLRTPLLYATMAVTSLLALAGYALISAIERRVITWSGGPDGH